MRRKSGFEVIEEVGLARFSLPRCIHAYGSRFSCTRGTGERYEDILRPFRALADPLVATGTAMPKSEVKYGQSITLLLETYIATKDRK
jgi:hypothetical protein